MLLENLRSFRLSVIISGRFDDTSSHSVATKMWGNYAFATRCSEWIACHSSSNMMILPWKHEKKTGKKWFKNTWKRMWNHITEKFGSHEKACVFVSAAWNTWFRGFDYLLARLLHMIFHVYFTCICRCFDDSACKYHLKTLVYHPAESCDFQVFFMCLRNSHVGLFYMRISGVFTWFFRCFLMRNI